MRIGYACLAVGVPDTKMRGCLMKNATPERLTEIIHHNLTALEKILEYNLEHDIRLFRISSGLIPFGSAPVNSLPWWDMYEAWMQAIGKKILSHGMRVSMHPGQYTVLNSNRGDIVSKATDDLAYHVRVLDTLGLGPEHKIILHVGGLYEDKETSIQRFMRNYERLPDSIRRRLVIENDDKCFAAGDVQRISEALHIPVVYDLLHNAVNPGIPAGSDREWLDVFHGTWRDTDGPQKIHYAQQDPGKSLGSHSESIRIGEFMQFFQIVRGRDVDIMLEVKDKNLSAVQCLQAIREMVHLPDNRAGERTRELCAFNFRKER